MYDPFIASLSKSEQAKALLKMSQIVRKDQGGNKARSLARAELFCSVAICFELCSLNRLAEIHLPDSELSERSLDPVFEDGDISDLAIREIVRLCDTYPDLEGAINHQYGQGMVEQWRGKYPSTPARHAPVPVSDLQYALF